MSTVLDHRTTTTKPGAGAQALIGLALIGAIAFVALAALPYAVMVGSREAAEKMLSEIQLVYWPRRGWLLIHILGGLLAVLSGPVQLWLGLSDHRMGLHRRLGMLYVAAVAVGSIGGIGLAVQTDFGLVFGTGLFFLAIAWIATTGLAFASIRKGLISQHQEWMVRSYVVTFAFVVFRVGQVSLDAAGIGTPPQQIEVMAWAAWAIPLLVTEAIIQGRKIAAVRA